MTTKCCWNCVNWNLIGRRIIFSLNRFKKTLHSNETRASSNVSSVSNIQQRETIISLHSSLHSDLKNTKPLSEWNYVTKHWMSLRLLQWLDLIQINKNKRNSSLTCIIRTSSQILRTMLFLDCFEVCVCVFVRTSQWLNICEFYLYIEK